MTTLYQSMVAQNQGQAIGSGWNVATLTNITALIGTDGQPFLPVYDRGLYTAGVIRNMPTGAILYSGLTTVTFIHPVMTDGQLDAWLNYVGNVTIQHHITDSIGKLSVQKSNAVLNFDRNQFANLTRRDDGWQRVASLFIITEVLS